MINLAVIFLQILLSDSVLSPDVINRMNMQMHPEWQGVRVGAGRWCIPQNEHRPRGPVSYSVYQVGQAKVPVLSAEDRTVLRRIERHINSRTLRFFVLPEYGVVFFDAKHGPCADDVHYRALNLKSANAYYNPAVRPYTFLSETGDIPPSPRPWLNKK